MRRAGPWPSGMIAVKRMHLNVEYWQGRSLRFVTGIVGQRQHRRQRVTRCGLPAGTGRRSRPYTTAIPAQEETAPLSTGPNET